MSDPRLEAKRKAEVMLAFAQGKSIVCQDSQGRGWLESADPPWNWGRWDYKVAPEKARVQLWRSSGGDIRPFMTSVEEPDPLIQLGWSPCSDIIEIEVKDAPTIP